MLEIKRYNLTVWIIIICTAVCATVTGVLCGRTNEQILISLLPTVYVLSLTLSGAFLSFIDSSSPGFMIINVLYFIKCVIYPFLSVVGGTTYDSGNNDTMYAICLEFGEVVIIYAVFYVYNKLKNTRHKGYSEYSLLQNNLNNGRFITFAFLLFVVLICIAIPGALSEYNFFTVESLDMIYKGIDEAGTSGIVTLIIRVARYVLNACLIGFCYCKYKQTNKVRYIFIAIAVVGLTMMMVRGVSRSDFVIPGICGYFLLIRCFPKHGKAISISLVGCLAVVFITFSLMRYGKTNSLPELAEMLQAYFCCEKNMAIAIEARRTYGGSIGISTFVSDLCGNWAGVGALFRGHYDIREYFNFTFYGHTYSVDQIVPTIGQAYMQFGFLGTYVYTVLMVLVCLVLDDRYSRTEKIDFSYFYLYGTVKCAVTLMGNLKIFSATMFNVLLPMLVLFWINSKMAIKTPGEL